MKIYVKLEASETTSHARFDLEDLNVTEKEWNDMPFEEKQELVKNAVYDLPDQPYWSLESFEAE